MAHSREHVQAVCMEDSFEAVVAEDYTPIRGILHVVLLDVVPYPFDRLRSRQSRFTRKVCQRVAITVSEGSAG